jgi:hypothetical protein
MVSGDVSKGTVKSLNESVACLKIEANKLTKSNLKRVKVSDSDKVSDNDKTEGFNQTNLK